MMRCSAGSAIDAAEARGLAYGRTVYRSNTAAAGCNAFNVKGQPA
jgi:DhnA family fructose-bisphosphate aldolase class Ia